MKLIKPTAITDANLASSSVPEYEFSAWISSVVYAQGAHVIKSHRVWQSVQASNIGHDPELSDVGWWVDVGPTNRWAMFDGVVGTSTTAQDSLSITLAPGRVDSIALLNVNAATVTVTMNRGVEVAYTKTVQMTESTSVIDWLSYFYDPILTRDYLVLTDLPVFGEATITITLSKLAGPVSCGMCIVGLQSTIGGTLRSPTLGINDYSKKTTDEFGSVSLVKRSFSKRMGVKLVLRNSDVDRVHSLLSSLRAEPVIWVGTESYSSMLIYGFYRDFEIDIAYARESYCTINIEGMI